MSDHAKVNVVSLNEYGQSWQKTAGSPRNETLLEVSKIFSKRLQQHVGRMMEKVDDALFSRAEKAESDMAQTRYFDAMRELRIIRKDIEKDFIRGIDSCFNQGVPRHNQCSEDFNLNFEGEAGSGLVDKNDMEESLAITNMVNKIRGACTQSLYSLDRRIGFLIRDPDLEHWQNPAGPEALCEAFKDAARHIETGLEIRLVIFKLFDQYVVCHIDELYKELNQHLIQLGVLPEIRATVHRSGHTVLRPQTMYSQDSCRDTIPDNVSANPPRYTSLPTGAYPISAPQASINALTFLQQGDATAINGQYADLCIDPSVIASGSVNILREISSSPVIKGLGNNSVMTIEMVAMLFDYILGDRNIPSPMRVLIGRLQIPVLKVALMEGDFFSHKSHPVRQLLNCLAETAVSWDEQQGDQDPLYHKVETIVQTILDEFEHDSHLFKALLDDLDSFLKMEQEDAEIRADRSARIMEGQEHIDIAKSTAQDEIIPRVNDADKLNFVRDFIATHWKNLLFIICTRQGKDSEAWKQAVSTMDELIWSIKPKHTLGDRQRLISIQPGLLSDLRSGMERLSIPATERDDFISKLVHAHGRTATNRDTDVANPSARTEDQEDMASSSWRSLPENIHVTIDDDYNTQVKKMKPGMWMEIKDENDRTRRAKLSWISPITHTYLFTNRQGLKAFDYKQDVLADLLRTGRGRLVDGAPLMDRAVDVVLKECQSTPIN